MKLLLLPGVAVLASVWMLARWAGDRPHRRRVFFKTLIAAPVVLLALEAFLAYKDWREGWRMAPLRLSRPSAAEGMFIRSAVCNYKLRPSRRYPLWEGTAAIDRNGFRSPLDTPRHKDPDRIRIILTGGSSAFGWGVPDGGDAATHLQELLNEAAGRERFEVINAGVPYFISFQEVNWYLHVLSDFEPDMLMVLDGRNDLWVAAHEGRDWKPVREEGIGRVPVWDPPPPPKPSLSERVEVWATRSALYRRLYWRAERLVHALSPTPASATAAPTPSTAPRRNEYIDPRCVDQFVKHWGILAAQARHNGTPCILALQPIIHYGKRLTTHEEEYKHMFDDHGNAIGSLWPTLRRAVGETDWEGAVVLDLSEVFADFPGDAYVDECHYTSAANRLIAARLAERVRQRFPKKP